MRIVSHLKPQARGAWYSTPDHDDKLSIYLPPFIDISSSRSFLEILVRKEEGTVTGFKSRECRETPEYQ